MNNELRRWLIVSISLIALSSSACSSVAAYQRGRLAHFSMQANDANSVGRDHLYAIQEGAIGGEVRTAGGCGCN